MGRGHSLQAYCKHNPNNNQLDFFWLNYNLFTYLYFFLRLILNIIATTDEIINPTTNENIQRFEYPQTTGQ